VAKKPTQAEIDAANARIEAGKKHVKEGNTTQAGLAAIDAAERLGQVTKAQASEMRKRYLESNPSVVVGLAGAGLAASLGMWSSSAVADDSASATRVRSAVDRNIEVLDDQPEGSPRPFQTAGDHIADAPGPLHRAPLALEFTHTFP
jgi:hypothetical protein